MNNLVSVIVPIYKVEKYLPKCIDSIINQTYKNLEIILVDDGSPDNCGKICDAYAKKDKRIKVVHKKNGGLSDSRNYGIKLAKGKYICFVDSDDSVSEFFVEKLLNGALENKADICACDFYYVDENGNKWSRKEKEDKVYSSKEAIFDIFTTNQNTEVMACNKIYKKDLFVKNNIFFPVGKVHEDNFTTYKIYDHANKVVLISDKLYFYLQRENSIMSTFNEKRLCLLDVIKEIEVYFKDEKEKFDNAINSNELIIYLSLLNNMIFSNFDKNKQKEIRKLIINNKQKYWKNKFISFQKKIMIFILWLNIDLYSFLLKTLKKVFK